MSIEEVFKHCEKLKEKVNEWNEKVKNLTNEEKELVDFSSRIMSSENAITTLINLARLEGEGAMALRDYKSHLFECCIDILSENDLHIVWCLNGQKEKETMLIEAIEKLAKAGYCESLERA